MIKRAIVIGRPGAGKSTFARKLTEWLADKKLIIIQEGEAT